MVEKPKEKRPNDRPGTKGRDISWNQGVVVAGLAMSLPALLLGPPVLGYLLDQVFGTGPWLAVIFLFLGFIGTVVDIFILLKRVGLME